MKIGIVWEHGVSKWSMTPFEKLACDHDITVFIGRKNKFDTSEILLNKKYMTKKQEIILSLKNPRILFKYLGMKYKRFYFYLASLSKYITDDFDIIICHDGSRSLSTLTELKKSKKFKLVVSYAENIPFRSIYDPKTDLIKKNAWQYIDAVVPWCRTIEQALLEEGVTNKIVTIPMGVNQKTFYPLPKDLELCDQFKLDKEKFTFSYIGKLVSWKGVQYLLLAANTLVRSGIENFQITITGKGVQLENLKAIIKDAQLEKYIKFTGFLPYKEISRLFSITDCLVLPSVPTLTIQEQFGMVAVEAMSCRKPVLVADTGSLSEVAAGASLIHTPGNWRGLANDMQRILQDKDLYASLAETGYQRAINEYSAERTAMEYGKLLQDLVSENIGINA